MNNKQFAIIIIVILICSCIIAGAIYLGLSNNHPDNNTTLNNTSAGNNTTVKENHTVEKADTSNSQNSQDNQGTHIESTKYGTFNVDSNGVIHGGQCDGSTIDDVRRDEAEYDKDPEHYYD